MRLETSHFIRLAAAGLAFAAAQPALAEERIRIGLTKTQTDATIISFGVPLAPGVLTDPARVQVVTHPGNAPIANVRTKTLLSHYNTSGTATSIKSVLVQFPASAMPGTGLTVEVIVGTASPSATTTGLSPFSAASFVAPEVIETTDRRIALNGGVYSIVETNITPRTLFTGTEPKVLATYPDGYLAGTGIFGELMSRTEMLAKPKLQGMKYLSDNFASFTSSNMYADYRMHPPAAVSPPPYYDVANFEGWLYDRCATYLTAYAHLADVRHLRYAYRACSYYSGQIGTTGSNQGIFLGKPTRDTKYSHLRGVYLYYAMTGDEAALAAGTNMAIMWNADTEFVSSYRTGRIASSASLWTERLLSTSFEGLTYGFALTGSATYRTAAQQIFETAYRHITTADQAELNLIMRTVSGAAFPPQNCWIHSAAQHAEGGDLEPWCSSWMSELIVDPMRAYQEITGDNRVDEVFIRLGRFMRDVGTSYFTNDVVEASKFTDPTTGVCYTGGSSRRLIPSYGAGINQSGVRQNFALFDDNEHCADATALMSSAIRSLHRTGQFNNPYNVAGLQTEGRAFVAMFHEFSSCAKTTFTGWSRTGRDPRLASSSFLSGGYAGNDPTAQANFMRTNKIGFPSYPADPQRKLSWWFNTSMLTYRMMDQVGIDVSAATGAGYVQGASCAAPTAMPPTTPVAFTAGKAGQTITFGAAPVIVNGGSGYVTATATSGLLPTYTSTTPAVCTVSGNRVAAVAQGTCIVAANQPGDANYSAAPQATQVIGIGVPADAPRLANISTRMQVQTGDNVMIGGFIIGGATAKQVVVRARGPSLTAAGVPGALANPMLDLYSGQSLVASNNDFGSAANLAALQSSGFAPSSAAEAAILTTLNPGAYTAIVSGVGATTGVGIVEIFEVNEPAVPLVNISTRGRVLTGSDVMIGGFIIQGAGPQTVVVRARGPSLAAAGVPNPLANPMLQLFSGATQVAMNDDWGTAANAAQVLSSGFAPSSPFESAILITLNPGAYTAIVTGVGGGTGVGIIEVFSQ